MTMETENISLTFEIHTDESGKAVEILHPFISEPIYRLSYDAENQLTVFMKISEMSLPTGL